MTDPRTAIGEAQRIAALWTGPPLAPGADRRADRTRLMGGLGIAVGLLFTLVILSQWIPGFVLSPR